MKQAVLTGIRRMAIIERGKPQLKNDSDVLIRLSCVGVCGSDIHYFVDGRIGSQVVQFPFAVGHECSGVIEEVGRAVTRVKPGDLVAVDPSIHCGVCDQCLSGRPHTCRNNRFLGCPGQIEGCLSDYIVMPEFCCYALDASFSPVKAALIEPLTIGIYSVEQAQMSPEGKTIGIFGAGPIGLSVLLTLRTTNSGPVYCIEPLGYRREKALELGATLAIDPNQEDVEQSVLQVEPWLLDLVFECSGQQDAVDNALKILKPGGRLVLVGIPPEARYVFDMDLMRRKEISVQNVRRQNHCVEKAIRLIRGGLPVEKMVTHHFSLAESERAFNLVADYRDEVIKAVIDLQVINTGA